MNVSGLLCVGTARRIKRIQDRCDAPIGIIIGLVAALVAGLVWFFTQTEVGQKAWSSFVDFLVGVWNGIAQFFVEIWNSIIQFFVDSGNNISSWWSDLWSGFGSFPEGAWNGIVSFFKTALQWVVDLFMNWTIYGLIIKHWDEISQFFANLWSGIKGVFESAVLWISETVSAFLGFVGSVWSAGWSAVSSFFSDIWNRIIDAARGFGEGVKNVFTVVVDFVRGIPGTVIGFFVDIGSSLMGLSE